MKRHKEWYLKNYDKHLKYQKEWRDKNREHYRKIKRDYYYKLKAKTAKEIININNQILKKINKPKTKTISKRKELTETQIRLREILKDSHAISALCKLLSTNHNKRNNK